MQHRHSLLAGAAAIGLTVAGIGSPMAGPDYYGPTIIPGAPPFFWQGFYVGGNLGGVWSSIDGAGYHDLYFPGIASSFQPGGLTGAGAFGGLQLGYNWQTGCCYVVGIEADIGDMDAGLNTRTITVAGTGGDYASFKTNADAGLYGDIAARAGYSWGHTIFYAKGGFAWFDLGLSASETVVTASGTSQYGNGAGNGFLTGWTAGAGFETMINPNWSWKIEYQYFDFSNGNDGGCCFDGVHNFRLINGDLTISTVKVGFNYIFNYAQPALK